MSNKLQIIALNKVVQGAFKGLYIPQKAAKIDEYARQLTDAIENNDINAAYTFIVRKLPAWNNLTYYRDSLGDFYVRMTHNSADIRCYHSDCVDSLSRAMIICALRAVVYELNKYK